MHARTNRHQGKSGKMKTSPPAAHGAHWPRGKRRHADVGDWSHIRLQVQSVLDAHWSPGERSLRAIAEVLGVSDRAVRRWMSGEDRPPPEKQEELRAWLQQQRKKPAKKR